MNHNNEKHNNPETETYLINEIIGYFAFNWPIMNISNIRHIGLDYSWIVIIYTVFPPDWGSQSPLLV